MDGYGGVVLARFARRKSLWQKRLTVKSDSSVAEFPSFYAIKLVRLNVLGVNFGLIQVEFDPSYGMVFRFVSGGLLVFGNPKRLGGQT